MTDNMRKLREIIEVGIRIRLWNYKYHWPSYVKVAKVEDDRCTVSYTDEMDANHENSFDIEWDNGLRKLIL